MCHSAQIWTSYNKYGRAFGAGIPIKTLIDAFHTASALNFKQKTRPACAARQQRVNTTNKALENKCIWCDASYLMQG